jgi:hypothetical protein
MKFITGLFTAIYRIALVGVIGALALALFLAIPEVSNLADQAGKADEMGEQAAGGFFNGLVDKFKRIVKYDVGRESSKVANNVGKTVSKAGKDIERETGRVADNIGNTASKAVRDVGNFFR